MLDAPSNERAAREIDPRGEERDIEGEEHGITALGFGSSGPAHTSITTRRQGAYVRAWKPCFDKLLSIFLIAATAPL